MHLTKKKEIYVFYLSLSSSLNLRNAVHKLVNQEFSACYCIPHFSEKENKYLMKRRSK